jgi:hypothetical protein
MGNPRSFVAGLALTVAALLALAPAASAPAPSAEAQLVKLEHDYARALIRKDMKFLRAYYAPEWRGGDWMGFASKTMLLNMVRNQRYVVKSMKLGEIRARVYGDIGIVQGVDEEISFMGKEETSGTWGFTDIFQKRGGRWVAIASQTTKIEKKAR